jgi:hypothetical protein
MAKETILIGCRLPNGLVLHHPKNRDLTVKLAGTYGAKMDSGLYTPPRAFTTTPVDLEFWTEWKAAYVGFPPLKTRAVFEARSDQEAGAKAKDTDKTGFEPMSQTAVIDGVKLEQATS